MLFRDVLHAIVDDGIEEVRAHYWAPEECQKREGAIRGFEECRNKQPMEIGNLMLEARRRTIQAFRDRADDYWYWRYREIQIEWVANVVSAILMNEKQPTLVQPTYKGLKKAAEIVGVR